MEQESLNEVIAAIDRLTAAVDRLTLATAAGVGGPSVASIVQIESNRADWEAERGKS